MNRTSLPINMPKVKLNVLANRTFGVELEVVGITQDDAMEALQNKGYNTCHGRNYDFWSVVNDVSLRCNDCIDNHRYGCTHRAEIVTPILSGEEGLFELGFMLNTLKEAGAYTNETCGTHVHVGAVDIEDNLYAQSILMHRYVGFGFDKAAGRYSPEYAPVMLDHDEIAQYVNECSTSNGSRYNAVNLINLTGSKKTVEFRQLAGTLDYNTLEQWICAVTNLVEEVKDANGCFLCDTTDHQPDVCDDCSYSHCSNHTHCTHCSACDDYICENDYRHESYECPYCEETRCNNDCNDDYHGNYCEDHMLDFCGEGCPSCEEIEYLWRQYCRFMGNLGHNVREF